MLFRSIEQVARVLKFFLSDMRRARESFDEDSLSLVLAGSFDNNRLLLAERHLVGAVEIVMICGDENDICSEARSLEFGILGDRIHCDDSVALLDLEHFRALIGDDHSEKSIAYSKRIKKVALNQHQ